MGVQEKKKEKKTLKKRTVEKVVNFSLATYSPQGNRDTPPDTKEKPREPVSSKAGRKGESAGTFQKRSRKTK